MESELQREATKLAREIDHLAAELLRDGTAESASEAAQLARRMIASQRRHHETGAKPDA